MSATTLNPATAHYPSKPQGTAITFWRGVIGLLGLVMVGAFAAYLISAVQFAQQPYPGMMLDRTMTVNLAQPTGNTPWAAQTAGVQTGDFITAVNGQALFSADGNYDFTTARTRYQDIIDDLRVGDELTIEFIRSGANTDATYCTEMTNGDAECTLSLSLMRFPEIDFLFYFGLPFAIAMLIAIIGFVLFRWRSNQPDGLTTTAVAFLSAMYLAGIFDVGTSATLTPVWIMTACWLGGAFFTLGLIFPRRLAVVRSQSFIEYVPMGLATIWGGYLVYDYLMTTTPTGNAIPQLATTTFLIGLTGVIALMVIQRERATAPTVRDQSNTILIGTGLMAAPLLLWVISRLLIDPQETVALVNFEVMSALLIFPNIAIAYAVLQYRRMDTDRVISTSLTYTLMGSALILSVYLISLGGALFAIEFFNVTNAFMVAAILFGMVVFFTPVRNQLQERIDAIYFRKRRDYQRQVEDFSRRLTSLNNYDAILSEYQQVLKTNIAPQSIFIYLKSSTGDDFSAQRANNEDTTDIRFEADSDIIELLQNTDGVISLQPGEPWPHQLWADRNRLRLLKATLVVPIKGTDQLNGFVIISKPRSGKTHYTHDEVRFVDNLSSQFAIATERSQVIESLEQRVRELDVLSQVGQAVNFTIEFDDLLELIYAQTRKLVDVPNFYIALYEEQIDQMYFAFFLEEDARLDEKEGIRWALDDDLFSHVVKTASAMRVRNFQTEMKNRGAELRLVTDKLRAWIGVPLTAGRRTLGVMAAAKATMDSEYTEEQFRFFRDIGALAATSLDKANLFNETRIRERQLTVLNDISRQLVATEPDVEKLLQIIMNSAVEILNAEAGSLLLNTDDDSGDLEFRVVVGGGGDDLLGTRINRGKGIVGEVVESSDPIIVNDAEQDPRHMQEISNDFTSRSLIAVPLVAQEDVIGVLEVINKKDGTPFVDDDAELLNTFAGQAAVAIENARLFQSTDQQLSERVEELETLERIDTELNRTTDLREVAEITVRSAMNVLQADAGALGIAREEIDTLEIVAIKGYEEHEYPEGAEGNRWRLTSGIVGRVMRSGQADITMDVSMDPDYDSKLKDSNSQITIPMKSGDEINAILVLEKRTQPRFSLPDWAFAQRIAEHASIAIANAQFYAALMNANESKSEFMGFAAHELKNPLSSVTGYADVLKSGMLGELNEKQQEFIQIIHSNAERMKTIINDLRDAARLEANNFNVEVEPMNVHHAVVETLRPYVRILQDKDQELINDVPEDLPLVMGDEKRLIQVLTNLVSNAHKYSPAETTIRVYAKHIEDYVNKQGQHVGEMVQVSVEDEGLGISEEDQKRLFKEQYFRSTNPEALDQPGTGLGMMLTQGIINQHEGEIWVDSTLGEGSTFSFVIPVVGESSAEEQEAAEEAARQGQEETQTEPASD